MLDRSTIVQYSLLHVSFMYLVKPKEIVTSHSNKFGDIRYEFPKNNDAIIAKEVWVKTQDNAKFEDALDELGIDYWYDLWEV